MTSSALVATYQSRVPITAAAIPSTTWNSSNRYSSSVAESMSTSCSDS
jgi:hypothetical protein